MALSSHELILVLRARDEASRVLRHFADGLNQIDREAAQRAQKQFARGSALATAGVAVAAAGVYGAAALNNMTNAAMDYNEEAAKTLTQVDGLAISLEDVKRMGMDVGTTLPVQFSEVQESLYDIFSSIETDAPGAAGLLRDIGKAAVGGKVDMQTAGRGIIQILNAWEMETGQATHVNDVMFQLVRKGVGTYEEFTKTLGRSIPSARKAGGSVEDLAGMVAFLTRNGLSAAMASTSAARAFDALAKPNTIKRMEDLGVSVTNAKGQFRPMSDIVADLRDKLSGLSDEARAAKLEEIFKGSGGTIQAMRFFNLGVKDGTGLLQELTANMHDAGGAAQEAYDIMANTPQAKLQLLNNKYDAMKVTIGDQLLPMKLKLAEALSKILDWFLKLSPETQKWIARIAALAAGLAIIIGVVMAVVGVMLMFAAAATMAGIGLGPLIGIVAGVVAGIALLVAAGVLLYQNWDTVKAKGMEVWDSISAKLTQFIAGFANFKDNVVAFAQTVWDTIGPTLMRAWNDITAGVEDMVSTIKPYWDKFTAQLSVVGENARKVGYTIGNWLGIAFNILKPVLLIVAGLFSTIASVVGGVLRAAFEMIGGVIGNFLQIITNLIAFIGNVFTGQWGAAWQNILEMAKGAVGLIVSLIVGMAKMIGTTVYNLVRSVIDFFKNLWHTLVGGSIVPDMVNAIIMWFAKLPGKVLSIVSNLVVRVISFFVNLAARVISLIINLVTRAVSFFASLPGKVIGAISKLAGMMLAQGKAWLSSLYSGITNGWSRVWTFITSIPGKIKSFLSGISLSDIGSNIMHSLASGLGGAIGDVAAKAKEAAQKVVSAVKGVFDIGSPSKVFQWMGKMNGVGLAKGMDWAKRLVGRAGDRLANAAVSTKSITTRPGAPGFPPGYGPGGPGAGGGGITQDITIYTQEIDPLKHAADLGWELAVRV